MLLRLKSNITRLKNILLYKDLDPIEYYSNEQLKISYIENAKVACTSIKKLLLGFDEHIGMELHEIGRERASYNIPEKGFYIFTVVRDPFERLASCYWDKIKKNGDSEGSSIFDLFFYKVIFYLFSGFWHKGEETTFEQFVHMVSCTPDIFSDRHIRSQCRTIRTLERNERAYKIIHLESLVQDWQMDPVLTKVALPKKENISGEFKHKKSLYTSRDIVQKVHKRYFNDIKKFGYLESYKNKLAEIEGVIQ